MSDEDVVSAIRRVGGDGVDSGSDTDLSNLTGPVRTLDGRIRYVWTLKAAASAATLGAVSGTIGLFALDGAVWIGTVVFAAVFALGVALAFLRYRVWYYEVRDDSLLLYRGVFTRVRTVVPYVRIQHVDVSRGPLERLLGLASVVVYTAGSRGADVTIPGLTIDRADDLQARLKQLAIVADGDDAV